MIREAKKSPNLPSASWKTRRAGDVIQSKSNGQRTWGSWCKSWSESESQRFGGEDV